MYNVAIAAMEGARATRDEYRDFLLPAATGVHMMNVDVYGPVFRTVLLPAWENLIRRRPTLTHLESLLQTAVVLARRAPRAAVQARSGALIRHAYHNVPFYRERFDACGVLPDDIATPEDLSALPVLTRADAAASLEARKSTAPPTSRSPR